MFFDIGWPELMLIGVVALVVIGPKDLPAALRVAGFWVRKARILSREFQSSVEQMIRESELEEVQKQLKKATEIDLDREIEKAVDPTGELAAAVSPPEIPDYFDAATAAPAEPASLPPPSPAEPAILPPAAEIAAADAEAEAAAREAAAAPAPEKEAAPQPAPSKT